MFCPLPSAMYFLQTKKDTARGRCLFMFVKMILFCVCKNLFLVVASACLAYSMWHHQSATLAALYKIWSSHFPVCSSTISSSLRRFILWTDRHFLTPPTVILLCFLQHFFDYINCCIVCQPLFFNNCGCFSGNF